MWRPNQNKGGGIVGKVLPKSGKMRRALAYSHSDREGHLTSIDIHLLSAAAAANHIATTTADFRGKGTGNESLEMDWGTDSVGDGGREGRRLQQRSARAGRPVIVHPLDKFCETEKSINVTGPEDEGEELLVRCLKSGSKCNGFTKKEFEMIEKTLSKFDGIYFLRHDKPKCVVMNQKSCSVSFGNLETGADRLTRRDRDMIRRASREVRFSLDNPKDLTKRYKTCAIVGNAPSLARDKFGALIDEYDAVFRLNHVQGANPEKKYPKRSGTKTTFRLFSKLPSFGLATGNLKVKATSKHEVWLFWHDVSRHYIPGAPRNNKDAPILMMSPFQINWQVKVYFALRREMVRLGLGPFQCPHNINSGLHAVLTAQSMCSKIGVFGLSYDKKHASQGGHFGNRQHVMSKKHDWGFDTLILRILHLSKQSGLCT